MIYIVEIIILLAKIQPSQSVCDAVGWMCGIGGVNKITNTMRHSSISQRKNTCEAELQHQILTHFTALQNTSICVTQYYILETGRWRLTFRIGVTVFQYYPYQADSSLAVIPCINSAELSCNLKCKSSCIIYGYAILVL